MAFPLNPADNDTYTNGAVTFKYSAATNAWNKIAPTWGSEQSVTVGTKSVAYRLTSDGKTALIVGVITSPVRRAITADVGVKSAIATALGKTVSTSVDIAIAWIENSYTYTAGTWTDNGTTGYGGDILSLLIFN